jgi:hypothetical protein
MAKHRSHSVDFKRQVAQEFLAGETEPLRPPRAFRRRPRRHGRDEAVGFDRLMHNQSSEADSESPRKPESETELVGAADSYYW